MGIRHLFAILCVVSIQANVVNYVGQITTPGIYKIGTNITAHALTDNSSVIQISSNDVILDLGQYILSQDLNASYTSTYGIYVDAGLNNITIRNGFVRDIQGQGLYIGSGCTNVLVSDIEFSNCGECALRMDGTPTNQIKNSVVKQCDFSQSATTPYADAVIYLDNCSNVRLDACTIYGTSNNTTAIAGIQLYQCDSCFFTLMRILNNAAYAFTGISMQEIHRCSFNECAIQFNAATGTGQVMSGYCLYGTAGNTNNMFYNCTAIQNSSAGDCYGFNLTDAVTNNIFEDCRSNGNTGINVVGFRLYDPLQVNGQNSFVTCFANNNSATSGTADGFYIDGSNDGFFSSCVCSYNSSTVSATGLRLGTAYGGSNWFIQQCNFIKNTGNSSNTSYGVNWQNGDANSFVNNFAFNNGSWYSNQLRGLPYGALSNSNTANLNTTKGFTNFQLIP